MAHEQAEGGSVVFELLGKSVRQAAKRPPANNMNAR
jgi:hypothetical protein